MAEIFTASGADHNSMLQSPLYFQPFQFIIILQKDGLLYVETNQTNLDGAHPLKMFTIFNFWIHIPPSQELINIPCSKLWALQFPVYIIPTCRQWKETIICLNQSLFYPGMQGDLGNLGSSSILYILLILEGTRSEKIESFPRSFLASRSL